MSAGQHTLCECGHPFDGNHRTPGTECSALGCECGRFKAAPSLCADSPRWHKQSLLGGGDVPPDERGDCVRACITSILGLPLNAVENVHGDGWWDRLRGEVHRHGYELALLDTKYEPPLDAYWIATLPSLNLGPEPDGSPADHCVVARGYTLIHDPSLGLKYDVETWARAWNDDKVSEGWVLVPLDPACHKVEVAA